MFHILDFIDIVTMHIGMSDRIKFIICVSDMVSMILFYYHSDVASL